MKINILRYSLFGIAGSQEVDHIFVKFIIYPLKMIALKFKTVNKPAIIKKKCSNNQHIRV